MLVELKKFKAKTILVLKYKKIDYHKSMRKILFSSAKLIFNCSDIDKTFRSMYQSVMNKIKKFISKDWDAKSIVEHNIKIFGF